MNDAERMRRLAATAAPEAAPVTLGPFDALIRRRPGEHADATRSRQRAHEELLEGARLKHYLPGELAIRVGDEASFMGVVQSGQMVAYTGTWEDDPRLERDCLTRGRRVRQLGTLGPGDLWGEVGIGHLALPGDWKAGATYRPTRSANVRARTEVNARTLTYERVHWVRQRHPIINATLIEILVSLVVRLTENTQHDDSAVRLRREIYKLASDTRDGFVGLSQSELAVAIDMHRATVNSLLGVEREAGRIKTRKGGKGLEVDLDALADAIDDDNKQKRAG